MNDESTAVLQGQLERAVTGDTEARQRLLELTRDHLMHHARRFLHGPYARLEPFAQTDDVVQQLYLKILQNQDRFWVNARGEPVVLEDFDVELLDDVVGLRERLQADVPSVQEAAGVADKALASEFQQ